MGSLPPAITSKLLLPTDRTSLHAVIFRRSAARPPFDINKQNMIRLCNRNRRHCVSSSAAANEAEKNSIDFNDPEWKNKYEQDFQKRFNIPHTTDFFPEAVSYPSTFCLRMRTPVSESVVTIGTA